MRTLSMGNTPSNIIGLLALSATAGLSLLSCTSGLLEPERSLCPNTAQIVELVAVCGDADLTRTAIQSDGKVWWTPGDAISLFFGSGTQGGSKFTSTCVEETAITTFRGSLNVVTGFGEGSNDNQKFMGLYPFNPEASCDGSSITTILPARQESGENTFSIGQFPTMGMSSGLEMSFYNICGGIKFSVYDPEIYSVTIKATGGEAIAGKARIGIDGVGRPKILSMTESSDEVVIRPQNGFYFTPGSTYYAILPPVTLSEGLTITYKKIGQKATYTVSDKTYINRSMFKTLIDRDFGLDYVACDDAIDFADPNFKFWCVKNYDYNGDGEVQMSEAAEVTSIYITNTDADLIVSLEGIKNFANLEFFTYRGSAARWRSVNGYYSTGNSSMLPTLKSPGIVVSGRLKTTDFSGMRNLMRIEISNCSLEDINLSACENLSNISIRFTTLQNCNLRDLSKLEILKINYCQLQNLDVSHNFKLYSLECHHNHIPSLDLGNNTVLQDVACYDNPIESLDVSMLPELNYLDCDYCPISSLDVSKNPYLNYLSCSVTSISSLDLSNNPKMISLLCEVNQLTSLNVSNMPDLTELYCGSNLLTALDVSHNEKLNTLYCGDNMISSLDVSHNKALTHLGCYDNHISSLDVSSLALLQYLECYGNNLSNLDVSNNLLLMGLYCSPMNTELETLKVAEGRSIPNIVPYRNSDYVPANTEIIVVPVTQPQNIVFEDPVFKSYCIKEGFDLDSDGEISELEAMIPTGIYCSYLGITSLIGLEYFTNINYLDCCGNNLSSLDVSKNTKLEYLYCTENQLTDLDVSENPELRLIDCQKNKLNSLDVSKNLKLEQVYVYYNPSLTDIYMLEEQNLYIDYNPTITTIHYL